MIISHDLGTTGDKATLVSNDGEVLAAVTSAYGTDFGPRGKAEQDPEDWWTALCTRHAGTARSRLGGRRGRRGGVVLRSDDGGGAAGPVGRAGAAGDHLGRHPLGDPDGHPGRPGRDGRGVQDHRAPAQPDVLVVQDHVGSGSGAGGLLPGPDGGAGQGLRRVPADRRAGHRPVRRLQHERLRPGGGGVVDRTDRGGRPAALAVPRDRPVDRGGRTRHRRRRGGHRPAGRHAGGDGRRRRSDGRARCGHHLARVRCLHLSRLLVLGLGGDRRAAARPEDAQHDLQPRAARPLRPDGDDAGRRRVAGVGDRRPRTGSGRPVRPVAGRGRGRPGERGRTLLPAAPAG